jgi:WD40 repeat protein
LEESNLHLKMNFVFGIETYNQNGSVIALSNPKRFLYFVSKIIVIYYPAENDQEFYRGHKFRVTSIVLLQDKVRVASGESAYRPAIHIWNTRTLETLRIIKSNHRWGIIELTTHQNILLSFGLKEIKYEEEVGPQNEETIF